MHRSDLDRYADFVVKPELIDKTPPLAKFGFAVPSIQSVRDGEGDTLVVDKNNFNDITFSDVNGMPHRSAASLIERLGAKNGVLQIRFTIDDPKTFAHPWEVLARFATDNC